MVRVAQVGREDLFELLDGLVMLLDERRQSADAPPDVHGCRRVGDVERRKEAGESGVGLVLLGDVRDLRAVPGEQMTSMECADGGDGP